MTDLQMIENDTAPSVFGHITDDNGDVDLTGCTVRFQMREDIDNRYAVDAVAVIVTAGEGQVRYDWAAGDANLIGNFDVRWRILFPDGSIEHTDPQGTIQVAI